MGVAFEAIYAATASLLVGEWLIESEATGGTPQSLIDTAIVDSHVAPETYVGGWILFPDRAAPDRIRRLLQYTPGDGEFLFDPVSFVVATGESYFAQPDFKPSWIETCINNALDRMQVVDEFEITAVANQRTYSLASPAPWLLSSDQILSIDSRSGDSGAYTYLYMPGASVVRDLDSRSLYLGNATLNSGDVFRVRAIRAAGGGLENSWGNTLGNLPNIRSVIQWAASEAALELFGKPYGVRTVARWVEDWKSTLAQIAVDVESYRSKWLPQVHHNLWSDDGYMFDPTGSAQP